MSLLKKRLSTPRAATVVVLAAVVAASVTVVPSVAQSFLTPQKAANLYITDKKAKGTFLTKKGSADFLKKKAAANLYLAKKGSTPPPVGAVAAGTAQFGPIAATTAGYIPSAFASFATKATVSNAVITFSGNVTCTAAKPTAAQACPVSILIDGQVAGKVNLANSTAESPAPAAIVQTATVTSVLTKGGHTVAVQYAGAKDVAFTLKGWSLAVEAYPQPEEPLEEPTTGTGSGGATK